MSDVRRDKWAEVGVLSVGFRRLVEMMTSKEREEIKGEDTKNYGNIISRGDPVLVALSSVVFLAVDITEAHYLYSVLAREGGK